jgi:hypothetical protein
MDALSLLDRAREAGLAVAVAGDKLIVRGPKQAEPVVRLLAEHKSELLAELAKATGWPARQREALAHWSALHPADEAARLAWGELEDRWHRLHGARVPEWQCSGCGVPIGRLVALDLPDGNRVHFDDSLDCLFSFGKRWRSEATAGLRALGLELPPGFELP